MFPLKVYRLFTKHHSPADTEIVNTICKGVIEILDNQGVDTISKYLQTLAEADSFLVAPYDRQAIDAQRLLNSYRNHSKPVLLFVPDDVCIAMRDLTGTGRWCDNSWGLAGPDEKAGGGAAVVKVDRNSVVQSYNYTLHEIGHMLGVYGHHDESEDNVLCVMDPSNYQSIFADPPDPIEFGFCKLCVETVRKWKPL